MKIVCIGGGHGLSRVLKALQPLNTHLTAIVATTDNGGSTGVIRDINNCVALGDIRRCCLELIDENALVRNIFDHRLSGGELEGHSLGNLVLLGLLQVTNSATEAVKQFNQLLGNQVTIFPMSDQVTDLKATLNTGREIYGETAIDALNHFPKHVELTTKVSAPKGVVQSILEADFVVIGPGSIISSVLPALLVDDIAQALEVTSATKVFIENIQKEKSVAGSLSNDDLLAWLEEVIGFKFWDLSLTPEALLELDLSSQEDMEASPYHEVSSLNALFKDLLGTATIENLSDQTT
ncbi:hypothetical protein PALB_29150 [Pseudoalteromonas luteoviolacea B = ATCC 29581]|nr:hypothetical protein PALB_29150 [Pseudoalteromonas luteoviolacea B = ATCC 29581]